MCYPLGQYILYSVNSYIVENSNTLLIFQSLQY